MKAWWPLVVAVLLPGGFIIAALEYLRRRHAREHAADYVERIQVLKSDAPLALPVVRPLRGVVVRKPRREPRRKAATSPHTQPRLVKKA